MVQPDVASKCRLPEALNKHAGGVEKVGQVDSDGLAELGVLVLLEDMLNLEEEIFPEWILSDLQLLESQEV